MPHRRSPDPDARELVAISREVGADPSLVQEGGGNTSVKSGDGRTMYVKASGVALARMSANKGYCRVRLCDVLALLSDTRLAKLPAAEREPVVLERLLASATDGARGRPSVETSLHAFLGRVVIHCHPALTNGLCCARDCGELAASWFADRPSPPLVAPYVDPGLPLARATLRAVRRYTSERGAQPRVIFLKNHGVFVSAQTGAQALRLTRSVEKTVRSQSAPLRRKAAGPHAIPRSGAPESLRRKISAAMRRVWADALGQSRLCARFSDSGPVREALAHPDVPRLMRIGPLTPDHVVYAHGQPVWPGHLAVTGDIESRIAEALDKARARLPRVPLTMLVSRVGLFAVAPDTKSARAALNIAGASLTSLILAHALGGCVALTPRAVAHIEGWEAEAFRRSVIKREG